MRAIDSPASSTSTHGSSIPTSRASMALRCAPASVPTSTWTPWRDVCDVCCATSAGVAWTRCFRLLEVFEDRVAGGTGHPAAAVVRLFRAGDAAAWNSFVLRTPEATFFHLAQWREVLERSF